MAHYCRCGQHAATVPYPSLRACISVSSAQVAPLSHACMPGATARRAGHRAAVAPDRSRRPEPPSRQLPRRHAARPQRGRRLYGQFIASSESACAARSASGSDGFWSGMRMLLLHIAVSRAPPRSCRRIATMRLDFVGRLSWRHAHTSAGCRNWRKAGRFGEIAICRATLTARGRGKTLRGETQCYSTCREVHGNASTAPTRGGSTPGQAVTSRKR